MPGPIRHQVLLVLVIAVGSVGCSTDPTKPGAGTEKPRRTVGTVPPGIGTFGPSLGEDLAAIKAWGGAAVPPRLPPAIDLATLSLPEPVPHGFTVAFTESNIPAHRQLGAVLAKHRVIEPVMELLATTLRGSRTIEVRFATCSAAAAAYDTRRQRVVICYELVEHFLGAAHLVGRQGAELGTAVAGATIGLVNHMLGYAFADALSDKLLPLDRGFATYWFLIGAGDPGLALAIGGAYWLEVALEAASVPFFDTGVGHQSINLNSFHHLMCFIGGSNPRTLAGLVETGNVLDPKECPETFASRRDNYSNTLRDDVTPDVATRLGLKAAPPPPTAAGISAGECWLAAQMLTRIAMDPTQHDGRLASPRAQTEQAEIFKQTCVKEGWSSATKDCVAKARTLTAVNECGIALKDLTYEDLP